jgi:hypothetical protein
MPKEREWVFQVAHNYTDGYRPPFGSSGRQPVCRLSVAGDGENPGDAVGRAGLGIGVSCAASRVELADRQHLRPRISRGAGEVRHADVDVDRERAGRDAVRRGRGGTGWTGGQGPGWSPCAGRAGPRSRVLIRSPAAAARPRWRSGSPGEHAGVRRSGQVGPARGTAIRGREPGRPGRQAPERSRPSTLTDHAGSTGL